MAPRTVEERCVAAMGTTARIVVVGGPLGLVQDAVAHLAHLEARWSRFLPDSDLARLHAAPGAWVAVHPDTFLAIATACDAWRRSAGRFDPTVHDALVALGYDRTFAAVAPVASGPHRAAPAPTPAGIALDAEGGRVRVPEGVRLDLGGIGKGLAADLVADALVAAGASGALVDVGGDLRAVGTAPGRHGWQVEVQDPFDPAGTCAVLRFAEGTDVGVATSSTLGRRWCRDGHDVHHLVDARTGAPLDTGAVAVTVVAACAWLADVACKVVLARDPWPDALGAELPALVFDRDRVASTRGDLAAYLDRATVRAAGSTACSPR